MSSIISKGEQCSDRTSPCQNPYDLRPLRGSEVCFSPPGFSGQSSPRCRWGSRSGSGWRRSCSGNKTQTGRIPQKKHGSYIYRSSRRVTFGLIKVSFCHVTRTKLSSFNRFSFSLGFLTSLWLLMRARYLENFL